MKVDHVNIITYLISWPYVCFICSKPLRSGPSSDGLIGEQRSIHRELEVDRVPLEVVVVIDVDHAVDYGLAKVEEEEHGHHGEDKSHEVSRDHHVDLSIALKSGERMVPAVRRRLGTESNSLLSQALNVLVDVALQLGLDLTTLHKLHHLLLLLVG